MAITALNQHRNELAKEAIDASPHLSAETKADLDSILDSSLAMTNGQNPEEKIAGIADNLYNVSRLLCLHIAEPPRVTNWKDVIIASRREIAVVALALVALFALRPQIALAFENLFGK